MPRSRSRKNKESYEAPKRDVTQVLGSNPNTRKLMEQVEGFQPPASPPEELKLEEKKKKKK